MDEDWLEAFWWVSAAFFFGSALIWAVIELWPWPAIVAGTTTVFLPIAIDIRDRRRKRRAAEEERG